MIFAKLPVFALAVLCGLWLGLIQAPYNLPYLGIFGFVAAHHLVRKFAQPYRVGYGFGLGYFLLTMTWIRSPFAVQGDLYGWMAWPAWVLMAAGLALFWLPIFRFQKHGAWAVAASFGAMELLRGWIFTGLPWALIAYGFVDQSLSSIAFYIGAYGLSVAIVFVVLGLFGPFDRKSIIGAIVVVLLSAISFGRSGFQLIDTDADFRVTAVQANITQAEAFDDSRANEFVHLQTEMSKQETDLVIWPEGAIRYALDPYSGLAENIASAVGHPLLIGAVHYDDDGRYYNSAHLIGADGQEIYRYDKQHLVPFGEYIPFGEQLRKLGIATQTITQFSMSKGIEAPWPKTTLPKMNILICYEGIFPKYAQRDGAFIALITNDSWFGNFGGPSQHLAAARYRAIESGKPVVRAAKTGISAIIDADGKISQAIPLNTRGVVTAKIGPRYESTVYAKLREWPLYVWIVLSGLMIYARTKRSQ